MVRDLCARVTRHFRSLPGKALATLMVVACMLIKYRWILSGLSATEQTSSQPRAAKSEPLRGPTEC